METLLEKLVAEKRFNEAALKAQWLIAGAAIGGDSYGIESHAKKHKPEEDKGFNIVLSEPDVCYDWYMQFTYGKYNVGAILPLWTGATAIMIIWLESIVLGRDIGVSFDEEGNDLHLFAQKIDAQYTNFIFFPCMDWQITKKPYGYQKKFTKRAFHLKIETRKLVEMFCSALQKYAPLVTKDKGYDFLDEWEIPSNVCQSKIIDKYLAET
jgi:hypothetical protein